MHFLQSVQSEQTEIIYDLTKNGVQSDYGIHQNDREFSYVIPVVAALNFHNNQININFTGNVQGFQQLINYN